MSNSDTWHLYLIRCADGSLYTGITTDICRRLREHEEGRGARRLRGRAPLAVVFNEAVGDRSHALRLEHRVKRLRRSQKELLISGALGLTDLAKER
ncbi:MAG: GIY-YIG nuclease family protein [Gammaproteobacteria bacterium]|nr:MAG: GIY-YIG nuclease family protein [Gammaproteobacteria bacterium]